MNGRLPNGTYLLNIPTRGELAVPSVTTVTGCWTSKGLARYINLNVAQAVRANPFKPIHTAVDEALKAGGHAAAYGTRIHHLADAVDTGNDHDADETEQIILTQYRRLLAEHRIEILDSEKLVAGHVDGRWYAGTLDRTVRHPEYGVLIADIKTSADLSAQYAPQMWAYANAIYQYDADGNPEPILHKVRTDVALVIWMRKDGREPELRLVELAGADRAFRSLLDLWTFEDTYVLTTTKLVPTVDAVTDAFPGAELLSREQVIASYAEQLWSYLRSIVRPMPAAAKDTLMNHWPAEVATFAEVAKAQRPLPTLAEMRLVEQAVAHASTVHELPFFDSTDYPTIPPGYTIDEIPPSILHIDYADDDLAAACRAAHKQLAKKQQQELPLPKPLTRTSANAFLAAATSITNPNS